MSIYVDSCIWGKRDSSTRWCHMMTDGDSAELRAFATRLNLNPRWIQYPGLPRERLATLLTEISGMAETDQAGAVKTDR